MTKILDKIFESWKDKKAGDDFDAILKVHLYIETLIEKCIKVYFKNPSRILGTNFSFFQKLQIIEACKIFPPKIIKSIYQLNKIRNNFSHNFSYKISNKDIDKLRTYKKQKKSDYLTLHANISVKQYKKTITIKKVNFYLFLTICELVEKCEALTNKLKNNHNPTHSP